MDPIYRETIDALNAAARAMHEQASGHHSVAEAVRRLEVTLRDGLKEIRSDQREEIRSAMAGLEEAIEAVADGTKTSSDAVATALTAISERMLDLEKTLAISAAVDEKTDQFRREVFDRTGKVLSSRPAMAFYTVFILLVLQTLGVQVSPGLRTWVAHTILGLPLGVDPQDVEDEEGGGLKGREDGTMPATENHAVATP